MFLHPSDELYGADRQLLALVRAGSGIVRAVVLLPTDLVFAHALSQILRAEGIDVIRGPLPVLRRRYARRGALAGWIARSVGGTWWTLKVAHDLRAEIIVTNTTSIPIGPIIARLLRRRHVWFVREIIEKPKWFRGMSRTLARVSPGAVLTVSAAVADWLGLIDGRGPVVLHDAVEVLGPPSVMPDEPTVVFVGRLNAWKGWEVFVRAAAIAHQHIPTSRFVLVGGVATGGDESAGDVHATIRSVDPSGSWLTWRGEVTDGRAEMRSGWVVAVPSRRPDPFPNVVLEAMAEGRAVVGTNIGGIPEMVVDGVTGLLVGPDDEHGLADAIIRLLSNRALAIRMGTAGVDRIKAEFSTQAFESRWRSQLRTNLPRCTA